MSFANEPILSRKIAIKSMTRHFAGWKIRYFTLDRTNQVLEVVTEGTKRTVIELRSASVSMGRHYYPLDDFHWFFIKYFDNAESCFKEVIMKFEKLEDLERWDKALQMIHVAFKSYLQESIPLLLDIFGGLIQEKSDCQEIIQHDDDGQEGIYYHHSDDATPSEAAHSVASGAGALVDSFMAGTADDGASTLSAPLTSSTVLHQSRLFERFGSSSTFPSPMPTTPPPRGKATSPSKIRFAADTAVGGRPTTVSPDAAPTPTQPPRQQPPKLRKLAMPKLNVLIMAVGTRGDIQPFRQFGMRLKQDGHRVRLATHELFRSYVLEQGLEFYPLAGDPMLLSEFMVKTGGSIFPLSAELLKEVPKFHAMICDIVASAWRACLEPDPKDEAAKPFAADAIISNPVTYAHCHCAEALGIPLHLMFPQPWVPTKAFPHPLSRLPYSRRWHTENRVSYELVDRALWLSFERDLNAFRVSVGLEPFRLGQYGWDLLNYHRVPFAKMWSPSIAPKPKDWPAHVDVVGSFFDFPPSAAPIRNVHGRLSAQQKTTAAAPLPSPGDGPRIKPLPMHLAHAASSSSSLSSLHGRALSRSRMFDPKVHAARLEDSLLPVAASIEPKEVSPELLDFLERPGFIVYVGFGSMVVPQLEALVALFLEAAALTGVRLLFQQGWSKIDTSRFELLAQDAQAKAAKVHAMLRTPPVSPGRAARAAAAAEADEAAKRRLEAGAERIAELDRLAAEHAADGGGDGDAAAVRVDVGAGRVDEGRAPPQPPSERLDEWDEVDAPEADAAAAGGWRWETDAFYMAECPHTWLFQQVSAVVHHGGAGTTSTGLRCGRPTWVCPFFGDQFFWGEMVARRGLGPRPCAVGGLTLPAVVAAFELLRQPQTQRAAEAVGAAMAREDGVENAVRAFYERLPLEHMVCEVSLMLPDAATAAADAGAGADAGAAAPTVLATVFCVQCGLKMSQAVADALHGDAALHLQGHELLPCCYADWAVPKPASAADGVVQGVGGYVHELLEGVADVVYDPLHGGYAHGLQGAATGLVRGLTPSRPRSTPAAASTRRGGGGGGGEGHAAGGATPTIAGVAAAVASAAGGWLGANSSAATGAAAATTSPSRAAAKRVAAASTAPPAAGSATKRATRFISHRASDRTLAVRRLRTSILQQIQRVQAPDDGAFAAWSREASSEGVTGGGLGGLGGLHSRSVIMHSSSFGLDAASVASAASPPSNAPAAEAPLPAAAAAAAGALAAAARPAAPAAGAGHARPPRDDRRADPRAQPRERRDAAAAASAVDLLIFDGDGDGDGDAPLWPSLPPRAPFAAPPPSLLDLSQSRLAPSAAAVAAAAPRPFVDSVDLLGLDASGASLASAADIVVSRVASDASDASDASGASEASPLPPVAACAAPPRDGAASPPLFVTSTVVSAAGTPSRPQAPPTIAAVASAASFAADGYGVGVGYLSDSTSHASLAAAAPMRQTSAAASASGAEAERHAAVRALLVFDRLGAGRADAATDPAAVGPTRVWSERRFAHVVRQAIARYEAQQPTAAACDAAAAPGAADAMSPPRERAPTLEEAIVRRPEHRDALLKHLLRSVTRDHDALSFVDFELLVRSLRGDEPAASR
eukprot:gene10913-7762_t